MIPEGGSSRVLIDEANLTINQGRHCNNQGRWEVSSVHPGVAHLVSILDQIQYTYFLHSAILPTLLTQSGGGSGCQIESDPIQQYPFLSEFQHMHDS